jgi:uncharacterized protein YcfJ
MNMKINSLVITGMAAVTVFTGCVAPDGSPDRTGSGALTGGAIGAGTGALIGSTSGHAGEGALIGAAVGLISGGLIGHSMDQEEQARLRTQAPATYQRVEQGQPLSLADIKALARSGITDDIIVSQIRTSRSVYRLSTADIIDLRDSGVSNKVIDFMINTASSGNGAQLAPTTQQEVVYVRQSPPAPRIEVIGVPPAPGYVWVGGEWIWNGGWAWSGGRWCAPPYGHTVWIGGRWESAGHRGWGHHSGHWR